MKESKIFGGALLITGTCIGAGMLALPVTTATLGLSGSLLLFLAMWLFMYYSGLLVLEANLWLPIDSNYITMARTILGPWSAWIAWGCYILLPYTLLAAYVSGGGDLLNEVFSSVPALRHHLWVGPTAMMGFFGIIIFLGAAITDYLNRFLMCGLVISFLILLALFLPHVTFEHVRGTLMPTRLSALAIPVVVTSFGFQIVVPSLRSYFNSEVRPLRKAILLGSLMPLVAYLLWELTCFALIPLRGPGSLLSIAMSDHATTGLTHALINVLDKDWLGDLVKIFVFFCIGSSFVGVAFSLYHFLCDGLHLSKNVFGRFVGVALTFLPPLLFSFAYPHGFIMALSYAGVVLAILQGFFPVAFMWVGRKKYPETIYRVRGGHIALWLMLLVSCLVIFAEVKY